MKSLMNLTAAGLLLVALAPMPGCVVVAAGAGAGTYAYVTGTLKSDLDATLDKAYAASQKAVKALEFAETSKAKDALQGVVEAKMADNTSISIKLKKKTDSTTEVVIRVGTFGDEAKSIMILDEIKKAL
ncbi:MAG: membrane protein [Phycisphaerae bacterium]|nr:MAG: membrane protein [Phycisphaerae bacterium]